jgi:hypothetical protein
MTNPQDRYISLKTKTLPDGTEVYKSAIPQTVEVNENTDITLVANERDRMDTLAYNIFGNASDWWKIAAANKHVNGSLHIKPGTTLIIPRK